MNKQNFFYPKKNNWDIGWPCSPRLFCLLFLGMVVIFYIFQITCDLPSKEELVGGLSNLKRNNHKICCLKFKKDKQIPL